MVKDNMTTDKTESKNKPLMYRKIRDSYPNIIEQLEALGQSVAQAGPISRKDGHLIQLAAAAAMQSEGSVHSHARRALEAGASIQEIEHSLLLLVSVIGFPRVAAALSWISDDSVSA